MVSSVSNNGLSSYFTNIISNVMNLESQSLSRMTTQRDTINVQRSVYTDLTTKINELRDLTKGLQSTSPFFALNLGRAVTVTGGTTDKPVLTATATSTAPASIYDINVDHLAQVQRRTSRDMGGSTTDLGLSTSTDPLKTSSSDRLYIGGTGPDGSNVVPQIPAGSPVTSFTATKTIAADVRELGSGSYTLETQTVNSKLQFRLLDENGDAVDIGDGMSSSWQDVPTGGGDFDTKRGLKITFGSSVPTGATSTALTYTAVGREISVEATDSLIDISNKINDALQPGDYTVNASVIGNQLILSNTQTGTAHRMAYSSWLSTNLDFGNNLSDDTQDLQKAANAQLTVNNLPTIFTPKNNSNIDDIIHGVTLNLTTSGSVKLNVSGDSTSASSALSSFVSKFNELTAYLSDKTSITKNADGKTYSRGTLADDTSIYDLRSSLIQTMIKQVSGGHFKSLSEIGIKVDDSLQLTVSDSTKFNDALKNNMSDVTKLMDNIAGDLMTRLDRFSGTGGYLQSSVSSFDSQITDLGYSISNEQTRLSDYQVSLVNQYSEMQSQLMLLSYQQQMMSSIYSSSSSSA
jgi:flagellar hook-associated protein 2